MCAYSTRIIEDDLDNCVDLEDFKNLVIPKLQDQRCRWQEKIRQIQEERGYSSRELAALCGVSEQAVRKWRSGSLPQSRYMYLRIGFAAGYGVEEMNQFLKRYGRCPQLYVRSLEDSVCIFLLRSRTIPHTYEAYQELLNIVQLELRDELDAQSISRSTGQLADHLNGLTSREEMIAFAKENAGIYRVTYSRLYNFVEAFLRINLLDIGGSGAASFHAMATESQWSSSLRHCVSQIRNKRWFPLRHKIISLGLHLNMDEEDINRMLLLAQMEPLYVKNPIEAAVKFAITEAKLSTPEDAIIPDGSNGLCRYVKNILQQLDLAESEYLIDDL